MSTPQPPYGDQPAQPPQQPGQQPGSQLPGYGQQPPYGYPQQPPPYAYGPPQGYRPPPPKRRPSAWWFLPGVIALVLAVIAVVVAVVTITRSFHTDGYVAPGARAQQIELEKSGDRMLFTEDGTTPPACTVTENGARLDLTPLSYDDAPLTVDLDGRSWISFAEFTTSGTTVTISCPGAASEVRVGASLGDSQLAMIGISVIGAIVLGLIGLAASVVVGVLFFTRRPRSAPQY